MEPRGLVLDTEDLGKTMGMTCPSAGFFVRACWTIAAGGGLEVGALGRIIG